MRCSIIFPLVFLVLAACKRQEPAFLDNFVDREKKKPDFKYEKQVSKQDLDILMATNEVNAPLYNLDHEYYYGFKEKLDDRHYLIEYADSYRAAYRFTHKMTFWYDVFHCIYDAEQNRVVSKLRVISTDPVQSYAKEEGRTYTIFSDFFIYGCGGMDCQEIRLRSEKATHTYKIINNRFVLVKSVPEKW